MKTNYRLISLIIIAGFALLPLFAAKADSGASLFLSPNSGNYEVNDTITVSVKINTGGETINAAKATLSFNENLEAKSVSKSGSIFNLWAPGEEPAYDNSAKEITFGGAGAGTTYDGSAGKIISITFKAKKAGEGIVNFSSYSVKYGATEIDVESVDEASFTISPSCTCTSWQNVACGENSCQEEQLYQERTCTPSACAIEDRCIASQSCLTIIEDEGEPSSADVTADITVGREDEEEEEKEETAEEIVIAPKEEVEKESLLASLTIVWGGSVQLGILMAIVILGLTVLAFLGNKEWKSVKQRKL